MWQGAPDSPYNNIIGVDPLLTDPENDDYRLLPGSPAAGYGCQTFVKGDRGPASGTPGRNASLSHSARRSDRRDEITVSGSITEDTTWNADKVNVVGDVTVEDTITLSIEPGVLVEFHDYYRLEIQGRLLAVGTAVAPILFTTDEPHEFVVDNSHTGCWNGIRFHDTPETNGESRLEHCVIEYSKATAFPKNTYYPHGGGALSACNFSKLAVTGCLFRHNVANYGGAFFFYQNACPRIANNMIIGNDALDNASAIYCAYSYPVIENNTIVNNTIHNNDDPYIDSCAVLSFIAKPLLTNNIIRGNDPEFVYLHAQLWSTKSHYTRYNNIEDHEVSGGNIDADPLFAHEAAGDCHLTWDSPCRDSGDSSAVHGAADFEGDPRIVGDAVDMGADELHHHLYTVGDVAPGSPIDVKIVGIPGMPALLGLGSGIEEPPLPTQHGDLWLTLPLAQSWTLGRIPQTGVLVFPATVPSNWIPGEEHPFQALVGTWGGQHARLTNLLVLTAE